MYLYLYILTLTDHIVLSRIGCSVMEAAELLALTTRSISQPYQLPFKVALTRPTSVDRYSARKQDDDKRIPCLYLKYKS